MNLENKSTFNHFLIIVALSAMAQTLFMLVFPNYLKEIYNVTEIQRGFIEFPREIPGVLTVFGIALLARYSDITIAIIAQILSAIGIMILGLFRPEYSVMLLFVFIYSLGMHMRMPIFDSLSMSISPSTSKGKKMGRYKGVQMIFSFIASIIVILGFKSGVFSIHGERIGIYIISASLLIVSAIITFSLYKKSKSEVETKKLRFVYNRKYKLYYVLTTLYGLQKQIMLVYSPWVIISYFSKGPDTLAMLTLVGSLIGSFFIPALGRWTDSFGVKKMLYLDAFSFVGVYLAFGLAISAVEGNFFSSELIPLIIIYIIFILDKMSNQMGMIRTLYLKKIAIKDDDVTPTLSLGLALDHVVSISAAVVAGFIWQYVGAQYIFYSLAIISLANVYVAHKVRV